MKIYDCFTFYNEFELLELRLKALWDVVDCFVLVEANKTHTNKPKPFYFWERQDEFKEFFPKLRHLPVEMNMPYDGVGDWSIENAQRNAIAYGLDDAAPDDLIMVSDVDEIPNPDIIRNLNQFRLFSKEAVVTIKKTNADEEKITCPAHLLMTPNEFLEIGMIGLFQKLHYYYFDWVNDVHWPGTTLIKRKNLVNPHDLRTPKKVMLYVEAGHHFSYMGGVDRVIEKMNLIVDGNELVVKSDGRLIDRSHIEKALATGADIYGRTDTAEEQFLPYDAHNITLPHIEEFLRKYPYFLREPEKYFAN